MRPILAGAAGLMLLAFVVQAEAATAVTTRAWQFKDAQPAALKVDNLIGDVRIERGTAAGFYVSVKVTAEADSDDEARAITRAVEFRTRDTGADSSLQVVLPEERFPKIYYAHTAEGLFVGRAHVEYLGEKRRVTADRDEGVVVRVDILVRAPAGASLDVQNLFGDATAEGYSGALSLDGAGGQLTSRNGTGQVELDSGSGPVVVSAHEGKVSADTGSGSVTVTDCRCSIDADTGSGAVRVTGGEGAVDADTGSGDITVEKFSGSVRADTGSGAVNARGLSAATELHADTGSGDVRISGDLSALQRLRIDTGSGGVQLEATAWPAIEIVVDTGSGNVEVDVPGAAISLDGDRNQVVRIGRGEVRGIIDTRSGSVRLRTATAGN